MTREVASVSLGRGPTGETGRFPREAQRVPRSGRASGVWFNGQVTTEIEQLDGSRVRLSVEVSAHDVRHAVDHAAADLAGTVRIPGFRKGKVPLPVLISRIGRDRLYAEAVESHIGGWFRLAAAETQIRPVEQPEFGYELPESPDTDWRFTATVSVQEDAEPADWSALEVGAPEPEVPAEAVDREIEELRRTVAELVPVEGRPAQKGDTVVIDVVSPTGEAQRDVVAELGGERLVEEIESALEGLSAGGTATVAYELADDTKPTVEVTLKEIKEAVLPPVDDELARAATEFDTLEELRADIETRLREQLTEEADSQFRADVLDALVEASSVDVSTRLVDGRAAELWHGLVQSLERRGIRAEVYLQLTGRLPRRSPSACARRPASRSRASSCSRPSPTSSGSRCPTRRSSRSSASRPARRTRTPTRSWRSSVKRAGGSACAPTSACGTRSTVSWPR